MCQVFVELWYFSKVQYHVWTMKLLKSNTKDQKHSVLNGNMFSLLSNQISPSVNQTYSLSPTLPPSDTNPHPFISLSPPPSLLISSSNLEGEKNP